VKVLPAAAKALGGLAKKDGMKQFHLRIEIRYTAGSVRHALELDPAAPTAADRAFQSGGISVVVLKDQVEMLMGCSVDYDQQEHGFRIKNPNFEGEDAQKWLKELARRAPKQPVPTMTLSEARKGFRTRLTRQESDKDPVDEPPPELFRTVRYESPAGKLAAYLSPPPRDGKKRAAIIWIFGGFSNGIGAGAWHEANPANDQSAGAFRKAGIIMMYPSLRGGTGSPGFREGFFGEVDDVLAAADFLAKQPFVDPQRIYLGGHSTGGTLVLLVAACSDRFRAVFSLGPVGNVSGYGADSLPFDIKNAKEVELRSPGNWLHSIRSPTFVFEGTEEPGNLSDLLALSATNSNPRAQFFPVKRATHFSIIGPLNRLLADKVVHDEGKTTAIAFTEKELQNLTPR
jgi:Fe-S cluster assembly iron-binding protein IscA